MILMLVNQNNVVYDVGQVKRTTSGYGCVWKWGLPPKSPYSSGKMKIPEDLGEFRQSDTHQRFCASRIGDSPDRGSTCDSSATKGSTHTVRIAWNIDQGMNIQHMPDMPTCLNYRNALTLRTMDEIDEIERQVTAKNKSLWLMEIPSSRTTWSCSIFHNYMYIYIYILMYWVN